MIGSRKAHSEHRAPSKLHADNDVSKPPHASIIIPVFNDQDGITRLLGSLRGQTLKDFEVIVVDNGSSPPIQLSNLDDLDVILLHCPIPGSYAARNFGALAARGSILVFTDADCVAAPCWLDAGITALEQTGTEAAIGGEVRLSPPAPRTGTGLYQFLVGFQQKRNIENKGFSVTANLFCTREQFKHIGPFDTRLLSGGDLEWGRRAMRAGVPTLFCPEAVVTTAPRISLAGAIRQARRVAAGRIHLTTLAPEMKKDGTLVPHRNAVSSLIWIIRHPELSGWERIRVLAVAITLRLVATTERLRLAAGSPPERR